MDVSIQARLQLLFDYVYPAGQKPYSVDQVAELSSTQDTVVTAEELHGILDGSIPSPAFGTMTAMANFFKVPVDYFSTADGVVWQSYESWIKDMRKRVDDASLYAARTNRWHEIREKRRRRKK